MPGPSLLTRGLAQHHPVLAGGGLLASHLFQGSNTVVIHKKVKVLDKKDYFLAQVEPNKFPFLFLSQTDKGEYKAKDVVKLRALLLDENLR